MKRDHQDEADGETVTKYGDFRIAHRQSLPRFGDIQAQPEVEGNAARKKGACWDRFPKVEFLLLVPLTPQA
jgi:hypothetical protein